MNHVAATMTGETDDVIEERNLKYGIFFDFHDDRNDVVLPVFAEEKEKYSRSLPPVLSRSWLKRYFVCGYDFIKKTEGMMMIMNSTNAPDQRSTIWLVGDSTVANYPQERYPQAGWGQMLHKFCRPDVTIRNYAVGGRSAKSFIAENRWHEVRTKLSEGDYVFIQFGHNDQKKEDETRYTEPESTYQDYLRKYIREIMDRKAHPILVTSVAERVVERGKIVNSLGKYPWAMRKVAAETKVPVIDLNAISLERFNAMGVENTKAFFLHFGPEAHPQNYPEGRKDNTHFSETGATFIAELVVNDARRQNLPISQLFK